METLTKFIDGLAGALAAPGNMQIVLFAVLFVSVVLAVVAASSLLGKSRGAQRMQRAGTTGVQAHGGRFDEGQSGLGRRLSRVGKVFIPADDKDVGRVRATLSAAGYNGRRAVSMYYGVRVGLALGLPVLCLASLPLLVRFVSPGVVLVAAIGLMMLGYYLPTVWVDMRGRDRRRQIREGFPDALDLLLVCVESGLGLDAAFQRVGEEISTSNPVLAEQFWLADLEMRAGRTREDALHNFATRTGVPEISSFTTLLIQSQELGTSIGDALRVYAEDMRHKRLMRAEEKAHALPAKMSVPLVLCLLPAFMGVLLTPPVIRIIRVLLPVGSQ